MRITLPPEPSVDPLRAVKALLKAALRAYKLRCVEIAIDPKPPHSVGGSAPRRPIPGGPAAYVTTRWPA